jgi:ABC-type nitrate/sulfonate/bicarbonate transport system permease component
LNPGPVRRYAISAGSFILPLLAFCVLWEIVSLSGIFKPVLLPPPSKVFARVLLVRGEMVANMLVSLYRVVLGYLGGALAGVSLGLAMGSNRYIYGYFHPIISILMPVPGITWAPILVLVLGFGDPTLITVTFIASFFPVVYNTSSGVRSVGKDLIWAGRMMGAGRMALLTRILLPASATHIVTGLKLGLARGWRTLIAVEMIAAALWGLGYWIFDAKEYLRTSDIYAGIVIMAVVFALVERSVFGYIETRTLERWGMTTEVA